MVEQEAVNFEVAGSSPAVGAKMITLKDLRLKVFLFAIIKLMIKNSQNQTGGVHIVIVVVLVVIIVGALGFVLWKNYLAPKVGPSTVETAQTEDSKCESDDVEVNGTFCSEEIGVMFKVPKAFSGKFEKTDNYEIFEGPMDNLEGTSAGKSLVFYKATIISGQETLSLSVAKEPLRSGYASIGHSLQNTYFNATTGSLYLVKSPTNEYDSSTDTFKTEEGWSEGESVPSFDVSGTKIYYGKIGDAGVVEDGYLMTINDNLVIVKIKHTQNPMNASSLDSDSSFTDLNDNLKLIKVL
jgi:hypothetical protein